MYSSFLTKRLKLLYSESMINESSSYFLGRDFRESSVFVAVDVWFSKRMMTP